MRNQPLTIANNIIEPGSYKIITLPIASLYTQTNIDIPAHVFHGKKAGAKIFITGTIHGDEINSIEIIRRLLNHSALKSIHGTLIIIPITNVFGFILRSRYLPDRRDLNRSFPGSKSGSLASRLANILMEEIVSKCSYGIDLHTGAIGRSNMPQIRVNLDTPGAEDLAVAFDVPVILDAKLRDGSLRQAASELGIPLLVYEAGEALGFDEISVKVGVRGILRVLKTLGIISASLTKTKKNYSSVVAHSSIWVRATTSGLFYTKKNLSDSVKRDDILGYIHDPFILNKSTKVLAPFDGVIIGQTTMPLVNEGDATVHLASVENLNDVSAVIEEMKVDFL